MSFVDVLGVFFMTLWERLYSIIAAPANNPGMVWILFPMIVTLLLMTFYFGRYRREELGWNTAVGNALVLFFVAVNLLQQVYPQENPVRALLIFFRTMTQGFAPETVVPSLIAGCLLIYSVLLLTADFNHWLPKKFAFFISSGLPINILAYFGIVFVYSGVSDNPLILDWYTLGAFIILFIALFFLLKFLQFLEPKRDETKDLMKDAPEPTNEPTILVEK